MIHRSVILIVAGFVFLSAGCDKKKPEPTDSQSSRAAKELEPFLRELRDARQRLQRQVGMPDEPARELPDRELFPQIDAAKRELFELVRAMDRAETPAAFPLIKSHLSGDLQGPNGQLILSCPPSSKTLGVTITNTGSTDIVNPRLDVNGSGDWFDTPTIVAHVIKPGMSDREKALALWDFVVKSRRHDNPAHAGQELHDPVRLLNAYGYGYCDDVAIGLAVLAREAGLQSRVWDLGGHVVPEIYFDGGWSILDPDGETYFLSDDGKTIAGVEILQNRPDLVRKAPIRNAANIEKRVKIFGPENNRIVTLDKKIPGSISQMGFILRPGESIFRSKQGWGEYFSSAYYRRPREYANGRLTYRPVGVDQIAGQLIYSFKLSYPMLDGRIAADLEVPANGRLVVEASPDQTTWKQVVALDKTQHIDIALGDIFANGVGDPTYRYYVRLTAEGDIPVKNLIFTTDFQVAPRSIPVLRAGENTIIYHSESARDSSVSIDFAQDTQ